MSVQEPRAGKAALADFLVDQSAEIDLGAEGYPWVWEGARWYELVYCLIREACGPGAERLALRELVACLAGLKLIEVDRLAGAGEDPAPLLERLMAGYGLTPGAAALAARSMIEAAESLKRGFGGHIQRYLRLYGERMLAEIDDHFRFSALDGRAVGRVFTRWLQNAAVMPLSQMGPPVAALARAFDSPPEAAREAADEIGLGMVVFDEIAAATQPNADADDG